MLEQTSNIENLIIIFVSLVISITIHEAMHAFVGHWLGDDTAHREGRITLNPLKHIDPYMTILLPLVTLILFKVPLLAAKPVPFNPNRVKYGEFGAALVGVAGPLTNLFLAVITAGFLRIFSESMSYGLFNAFVIFMVINIGLFVFNMIPIPPLDGSRLLYSVAPDPVRQVMASLETLGIVIIFAIIIAFPGFSDVLISINTAIRNFLLG